MRGGFVPRGGRGGMTRPYMGGNPRFNRPNMGGNRFFKYTPKPFIPHVLFDFVQTENAFPRVKPENAQEEKLLSEALIKRNQDLTPGPNEQTQLLNLITNIQTILDAIILTPGNFEACQIDEIKQVGSFKKGTMLLSNKLIADICVVLKTLPTREAVSQLANKVYEELQKIITNPAEFKALQISLNDSGFEINSTAMGVVDVAVQVLVTTQQQNLRKLDPSLHLDYKQCHMSLASVKHARWFEDNASHSTIKVLIRLIKDVRSRFEGMAPLHAWLIDLLAHYAITNNPKREPLALSCAFKRVFQLISAGFFLPGSAGIIDPCEQSLTRVHTTLTLEQQDSVCFTSQTLLRVLAHGGFRQVLGLEGNSSIATSPSVWAGVVIIPSNKAYEPSKEMDPAAQGESVDNAMNSPTDADDNEFKDEMAAQTAT